MEVPFSILLTEQRIKKEREREKKKEETEHKQDESEKKNALPTLPFLNGKKRIEERR